MAAEPFPDPEPELLAFVHVWPGAYPEPCGHTFAEHEWGYEGDGECNGQREREENDDPDDEGPFSCYCHRSPGQIEIEYLRTKIANGT
jgi:hypothetical protein